MPWAMPGPRLLARASAFSPRFRSRATSTRRAPMAASVSAATRPIPEVAPVMTTVLPRMDASAQFNPTRDRKVRVRRARSPAPEHCRISRCLIDAAADACPPRLAMIPRYTRPEMAAIWDPQSRFRIWFEIEAHAADAMADLGLIPKSAAKTIWEKGKTATFDIARIDAIEREVKHDVIAFLTHLGEIVGPDARFVHQGMT